MHDKYQMKSLGTN